MSLGGVMNELVIKNLNVEIGDTPILKNLNLEIKPGEIVALLGPNGHGKSTLLNAIMGNPSYKITGGQILLNGENITNLTPDKRSKAGLFLAMQNPMEVPGLNSLDFFKAMINAHREKPMNLFQLYSSLEKAYKAMEIPFEMSQRNLNEGFSGGEKKKNEILQMLLLNPPYALVDEIDSGLDVDAIQVVAKNLVEQKERGTGFLVVSHYARLYHLIHPTKAVILVNGQIVMEGGPDLIERVDKEGYEWLKTEHGISLEKDFGNSLNATSIGVCATKVLTEDK